jgi:hypothetical protein
MTMKTKEKNRTPQEQCDYLAGHRDALRRQVKALEKELAKVEAELQSAAFAAGKEQRA